MSWSTKNASGDSLDKAVERNFLGYGIQLAAISGFEIKTASTGSKRVVISLEGKKVADPDFKAADNAQWGGKVGRASFGSWLANPAAEEELINKIDLLAKRLGVSAEVDAIDEESLESYIEKVMAVFKGKFGYWKLTAEEYEKDGGKVGIINHVSRFTFFKAPEQVQSVENDSEGNILKVIVKNPKEDGSHMTFDKANKYDYQALEPSEEEPDAVETAQGGGSLWGKTAEAAS